MLTNFSQDLLSLISELLIETDHHRFLSQAMERVTQAINAERSALILMPEKKKPVFETAYHFNSQDLAQPEFQICRQLMRQIQDCNDIFLVGSVVADQRFHPLATNEQVDIAAAIGIPLISQHAVLGLIYFDNQFDKNTFDLQTCDYLLKFSNLISCVTLKVWMQSQKVMLPVKTNQYSPFETESIIGKHPQILDILKTIDQIGNTDATVLIQGESGSGKELIARALHARSHRKDKPFIPVNCAAIPENLLESELFGHVKGAFTGALRDKIGWFELADGGTIFLDEVNDMSPALQIRLLRILQSGEYVRLGCPKINRCDVRVVAAANQDLKKLVEQGRFRQEVFYRLNVIDLWVPPLRDRRGDIPLLIHHFLQMFSTRYSKKTMKLSPATEQLLLNYQFPGNIRELENLIHRAVALAESDMIEPRHLPKHLQSGVSDDAESLDFQSFQPAKRAVIEKFEREYIIRLLIHAKGNITQASRIANMNYANLYAKIRKYGIKPHLYK